MREMTARGPGPHRDPGAADGHRPEDSRRRSLPGAASEGQGSGSGVVVARGVVVAFGASVGEASDLVASVGVAVETGSVWSSVGTGVTGGSELTDVAGERLGAGVGSGLGGSVREGNSVDRGVARGAVVSDGVRRRSVGPGVLSVAFRSSAQTSWSAPARGVA